MEIGEPEARFWLEPLEDPVPRVAEDEPSTDPPEPARQHEAAAA